MVNDQQRQVLPGERMVQVQCPPGVRAGTTIRIVVDGRPYDVVVPAGVYEGGIFFAKILVQPVVAEAVPVATPQPSAPPLYATAVAESTQQSWGK